MTQSFITFSTLLLSIFSHRILIVAKNHKAQTMVLVFKWYWILSHICVRTYVYICILVYERASGTMVYFYQSFEFEYVQTKITNEKIF